MSALPSVRSEVPDIAQHEVQVTRTRVGAIAIVVQRYVFHRKKRSAAGGFFWECQKRKAGCRARIRATGSEADGFVVVSAGLTHKHDGAAVEEYEVRAAVKAAVANGNSNVRNAVRDAIDSVPEARRADIPSEEALAQTARRKIRKVLDIPRAPANRRELDLNGYHRTQQGVDVLLDDFDVRDNPDRRVLLYAHPRTLAFLATCDTLVCDGTFESAPAEFPQIYTCMGVRQGGNCPFTYPPWAVPCVFVLMPDRKQDTYEAVFRRISEAVTAAAGTPFQPGTILLDFERAARNALARVFPQTSVYGCFFHLSQIVWRKIQAAGLVPRVNNDPAFADVMKALPALSFVSVPFVSVAFQELKQTRADDDDAQRVFDFFEINYVGKRQGANGPRAAPKVASIEEWNMHERTLARCPRTQNALEAWHRAFALALNNEAHPSVFKVLTAIIKEMTLSVQKIERCARGDATAKRPANRQAREKAIFTMVSGFEDRRQRDGLVAFAIGVGKNIKWPMPIRRGAQQDDEQQPGSEDDSEPEL